MFYTRRTLFFFVVAEPWNRTSWHTAWYWTPAIKSALRKIHLQTLNNMFEGLQQSENLQKDIIMDTEAELGLCTGKVRLKEVFQHHGERQQTEGRWKETKQSEELVLSDSAQSFSRFILQPKGRETRRPWWDMLLLFFGPNQSGQHRSDVFDGCFSRFLPTIKSESANKTNQGIKCLNCRKTNTIVLKVGELLNT